MSPRSAAEGRSTVEKRGNGLARERVEPSGVLSSAAPAARDGVREKIPWLNADSAFPTTAAVASGPPRRTWPYRPAVVLPIRPVTPKLHAQLVGCIENPWDIMFLDIETTGLSHFYDEITVVGWSFAGKMNTLVKGQNPGAFFDDAARARVLVTFNGIRFDTKFIFKELPGIRLPEDHLDLMYVCRRLGLKGGQKAIEGELGIHCRDGLADVDGAAAVLLWHRYLRGDAAALRKLVRYNRADIAAMGEILDRVIPSFSHHPDMFLGEPLCRDWSAPNGWKELPGSLPAAAPSDRSPPPRYEDLLSDTAVVAPRGTGERAARIVGIDLAGSAARSTGWCVLDGAHAQVAVLHTDDEILDATVAQGPGLVSIDSPLCLPKGRTTVDDSDPKRREHGIIRESERELKRRGVNVYPCLIQSMQKLTARGIGLARKLRAMGIPVIESYPGAAQDIMRIPRKGAGVEWLKQGLRDFGVTGEYAGAKVTHDELDAITSALVGKFHLVGMSEALGTDGETPLIVPKLKAGSRPLAIGVSGPIAAGKTTIARGLERRGFAYTRFSLAIDDLLAERGLPQDRLHRQEIGNQINEGGRQRWLSERTVARVGSPDRVVIDGLRFPDDHAFLVERFGDRFLHVFVDADADVRCARYEDKNGDVSFNDASSARVERCVPELRSLAHAVFHNCGDCAELERRCEELLNCVGR